MIKLLFSDAEGNGPIKEVLGKGGGGAYPKWNQILCFDGGEGDNKWEGNHNN